MRVLVAPSLVVALALAPSAEAQRAGASARPESDRPPAERVLIADSEQLVFRASEDSGVKLLSDVDREVAATIMRINRTRGTWQSYLLYTTPEMKVPAGRPGFTFTLPPPSRKELERRRKAAEPGPRAAGPDPAPAR